MQEMRRIFADFHRLSAEGWLILDTSGSINDLDQECGALYDGLAVLFYSDDLDDDERPDEIEVSGILHYDSINKVWLGEFDESTFTHSSSRSRDSHN